MLPQGVSPQRTPCARQKRDMPKLTDITIRNLPVPPTGSLIHVDDGFKGFGVRVSQGGAKTFVLTYGKERKRLTIGRYPIISLAQAREIAKQHLAERTIGKHSTPPEALSTLVERFMDDKRPTLRPGTIENYLGLSRHLMLKVHVQDVTPQMLQDIFDKLRNTPPARNHLIIFTKMVFKFAQRMGLIAFSPAAGFQLRTFEPRDRVLTDAEIKKVWDSATTPRLGTVTRLLILTGQRRTEIQHLTLDGDIATLKAEHSKNRKAHQFPVGALAQELLKRDRKFSGWTKGKESLASDMPHWTFHDLRRTFATKHAELGTPPHIIERILNHSSGSLSQIARTYNRFKYLDEMRLAMHTYEQHIMKIVVE